MFICAAEATPQGTILQMQTTSLDSGGQDISLGERVLPTTFCDYISTPTTPQRLEMAKELNRSYRSWYDQQQPCVHAFSSRSLAPMSKGWNGSSIRAKYSRKFKRYRLSSQLVCEGQQYFIVVDSLEQTVNFFCNVLSSSYSGLWRIWNTHWCGVCINGNSHWAYLRHNNSYHTHSLMRAFSVIIRISRERRTHICKHAGKLFFEYIFHCAVSTVRAHEKNKIPTSISKLITDAFFNRVRC